MNKLMVEYYLFGTIPIGTEIWYKDKWELPMVYNQSNKSRFGYVVDIEKNADGYIGISRDPNWVMGRQISYYDPLSLIITKMEWSNNGKFKK